MHYLYYLKHQALLFIASAISGAISYKVSCHFGWRQPIITTPEVFYGSMVGIVIAMFFSAYLMARYNVYKK
jgi:hypothetical protein